MNFDWCKLKSQTKSIAPFLFTCFKYSASAPLKQGSVHFKTDLTFVSEDTPTSYIFCMVIYILLTQGINKLQPTLTLSSEV